MPALKNTKHEKFIQNIIKGKSQRQAYKIAFGVNYDNAAIDCKASKLFNTDKVQTRYKELLTKLEKKTIMSAEERMEWLTSVVTGGIREKYNKWDKKAKSFIEAEREADIDDKIKAIDTLNKMSGVYVTRLDGSLNVSYEDSLRKVADSDEY